MSEPLIEQLRRLRRRTRGLRETAADDLRPFLHADDHRTFRRLPTSQSVANDVTVASTCTALMALSGGQTAAAVYVREKDPKPPVLEALRMVVDAEWTSSKLPYENSFTRALVLRTAAVLASEGFLKVDDALSLTHPERPGTASPDSIEANAPRSVDRSLKAIVEEMAHGVPKSFSVLHYQPAMTLGYWYLDAVDRLRVSLEPDDWHGLAQWMGSSFAKQMSLAAANHSALMDPVAMALASCGSARLRRIAADGGRGWPTKAAMHLPSDVELREGIRRLFQEQNASGIWPKYFALFHYPDGGSNFTFSFEMLEAVLFEFGESDLIEETKVLDGLTRAIEWCEANRLEFALGNTKYRGWNSGGQQDTLASGKPESWATATVHMFLTELDHSLSNAIDRQLLSQYAREGTKKREPERRAWDRDVMDTNIVLNEGSSSVKELIETHMMKPVLQETEGRRGRYVKLPRRRSALLFGPPGTSKTRVVRAFADAIGWPFVEINPSHFLTSGLNNIYGRTTEVFNDLLDLSGAVVLFDELDALVRRRPGGDELPLDVTREFLTTSMLPKLIELHDRGKVFYFMATNHRDVFDEAVTRAGRFDLHIFMGVPTWAEKLAELERFLPKKESETYDADVAHVKSTVRAWVEDRTELADLLDWFSFGETKALLEDFMASAPTLRAAVDAESASRAFEKRVRFFAEKLIGLRKVSATEISEARQQYELDRAESRLQ